MPPIPEPARSGFTTTTAQPLYWASWGESSTAGSQPLLVLHGGPGADHGYLLPQMLALAEGRELLFYDQRGGGRSKSDDREPIGWRTHVEDLERIIAEFQLPAPTIVGYSWGGLLALLYAIEAAAGRVSPSPDRLVLIDPAPASRTFRQQFEAEFARRQQRPGIEAMRAELASSGLRDRDPDAYRQRAFELSVAGYFADPRKARELTPFRVTGRVQQSVWESLGDYDLLAPGVLDGVSLPALLLHGRQDPIPLASSEGIARALRTRLVVIDGSGHVPYVERPDALFPAIESFLTATSDRRHAAS